MTNVVVDETPTTSGRVSLWELAESLVHTHHRCKGARLAHTLETDSYEESVYSDATVEEVFRGPGRLS